jgi:hypothetical protein
MKSKTPIMNASLITRHTKVLHKKTIYMHIYSFYDLIDKLSENKSLKRLFGPKWDGEKKLDKCT